MLVKMVLPETLVELDHKVHRVIQEIRVELVHREIPEIQEELVHKVLKAFKVFKEIPVILVQPVLPETLVERVLEEILVLLVQDITLYLQTLLDKYQQIFNWEVKHLYLILIYM
jgi:hypothetical protein